MSESSSAAGALAAGAFAAVEHIKSGGWDQYLHVLRRAIGDRQSTEEYKAWVLGAAEIRAGRALDELRKE